MKRRAAPKVKKRSLKKFFILPCCYLLLNFIEELIVYQTNRLEDPYLKTLILITTFSFGITAVAYYITPFLENLIHKIHQRSSASEGILGEIFIFLIIFTLFYVLYYFLYNSGVESLIPQVLRMK